MLAEAKDFHQHPSATRRFDSVLPWFLRELEQLRTSIAAPRKTGTESADLVRKNKNETVSLKKSKGRIGAGLLITPRWSAVGALFSTGISAGCMSGVAPPSNTKLT